MDLPNPPYPSTSLSKGWRFELDMVRLVTSDTWSLLPPVCRPVFIATFAMSWVEKPCGSLPKDLDLLGAKLGCGAVALCENPLILRGWTEHSDGRLYHAVVSEFVMRMLGEKGRIAEKQARYREKARYGSVTVALPVTGANPLTLNCFTSSTSVVTRPDTDGNVTVTLPGHPAVDAPAKPPKSKGSRIDADWMPSPAVYRWAATEGISNGHVDAEIGSFIDFWIAIPGADGVKADWDATFRNRMRKKHLAKATAKPANFDSPFV